MTWFIRPLEITRDGQPTGRFRMTATSDEDGGGPFGDDSHDHASKEEAAACEQCDAFVNEVAGFPSRKRMAEMEEEHDRAEYERLKAKYEPKKGP